MWVDTTLHNFPSEPGRNHVLVEMIDVSAEMAVQKALQASVGVACADAKTITAEGLVESADTAMYASKDQGAGLPVLERAA